METFLSLLVLVYIIWSGFALKQLIKDGFEEAFAEPLPFGIWFVSIVLFTIAGVVITCVVVNPMQYLFTL